MIRVIKKEPSPKVAKEILCGHCGATLEYTPSDLKRYDGKDISGGPDGREWFVCPLCNHDVTVNSW